MPVNHVLPAWDLLAGLQAAIALLAAERARAATGQGQLIELSLADVASATLGHLGFVADVAVNGSARERDGNYLYGSYGKDFATADGRRVMVVALTRRHWRNLVEVTGSAGAVGSLEQALTADFGEEGTRYQFREVISAVLAPWFAARPHADVAAALDQGHVLWGDYRTVEEFVGPGGSALAGNPLFAEIEQPAAGTFPVPGPVARAAGWGGSRPRPARYSGPTHPPFLPSGLAVPRPRLRHSDARASSAGTIRSPVNPADPLGGANGQHRRGPGNRRLSTSRPARPATRHAP